MNPATWARACRRASAPLRGATRQSPTTAPTPPCKHAVPPPGGGRAGPSPPARRSAGRHAAPPAAGGALRRAQGRLLGLLHPHEHQVVRVELALGALLAAELHVHLP